MEDSINEIAAVQHKIQKLLNQENGVSCHFISDGSTLHLVTFNPVHGETFLLHSEEILNPLSPISPKRGSLFVFPYIRMYEFVKRLFEQKFSPEKANVNKKTYTVSWVKDGAENKSYFYGNNMRDVIDKFYFGKEAIMDSYNILEIKLNPIS